MEGLNMQNARAPSWITFDCYGTLIDTRAGYVRIWQELLADKGFGADVDVMAYVEAWGKEEFRMIQGPYAPYREILRRSVEVTLEKFGLPVAEEDGERLAEAWGTFPPFPDVQPVLSLLRRSSKLAIISNVDDDIVAQSIAQMGVAFDGVFTAEQCRAYKPSRIPFEYALKKMGVPAAEVLHVAFGFQYDHTTAHELGFRTVWVNRRDLAQPEGVPFDVVMSDLTGLPALCGVG
jgi:2-haloacid dehalogenase